MEGLSIAYSKAGLYEPFGRSGGGYSTKRPCRSDLEELGSVASLAFAAGDDNGASSCLSSQQGPGSGAIVRFAVLGE